MQQSNVIFGMILIAFLVYITVRGELPAYISLLRGSTATGAAPGATDSGLVSDFVNAATGGQGLPGLSLSGGNSSLQADLTQLTNNETAIANAGDFSSQFGDSVTQQFLQGGF